MVGKAAGATNAGEVFNSPAILELPAQHLSAYSGGSTPEELVRFLLQHV